MEFIFMGTGTSGSIPNIYCLTAPESTCKTCAEAAKFEVIPGRQWPVFNKNKRHNTGGLLRVPHPDGRTRNIVIDVGKTFYSSALNWFVEYGIQKVDAVILTHGHADAIGGMDDLRGWAWTDKAKQSIQGFIPVYLDKATMNVVSGSFPYLVKSSAITGGGDVAALKFNIMDEGPEGLRPFMIDGLSVEPFRVNHGVCSNGDPFWSLGFRFNRLVYISDCNFIPNESFEVMKGADTLVIDALHDTPHASHLSYEQAVQEAIKLFTCPDAAHSSRLPRLFFTGLSHKIDHESTSDFLSQHEGILKHGIQAFVAYDGLRISL